MRGSDVLGLKFGIFDEAKVAAFKLGRGKGGQFAKLAHRSARSGREVHGPLMGQVVLRPVRELGGEIRTCKVITTFRVSGGVRAEGTRARVGALRVDTMQCGVSALRGGFSLCGVCPPNGGSGEASRLRLQCVTPSLGVRRRVG